MQFLCFFKIKLFLLMTPSLLQTFLKCWVPTPPGAGLKAHWGCRAEFQAKRLSSNNELWLKTSQHLLAILPSLEITSCSQNCVPTYDVLAPAKKCTITWAAQLGWVLCLCGRGSTCLPGVNNIYQETGQKNSIKGTWELESCSGLPSPLPFTVECSLAPKRNNT